MPKVQWSSKKQGNVDKRGHMAGVARPARSVASNWDVWGPLMFVVIDDDEIINRNRIAEKCEWRVQGFNSVNKLDGPRCGCVFRDA